MTATIAWGTATDTTELPRILRGVEPPTVELHLVDLHPGQPEPVRLTFRDDLRASVSAAFWPAVIGAGFIAGIVVAVAIGSVVWGMAGGVM